MIHRYRGAHAAYTEYLWTIQKEAKASDHEKQECLKRARDTETQQQKQKDICKKQKEAEQLILEANDRLLKAAPNQDTTDLLAAQALLQSGTAMLMQARREQDSLQELTQPSKSRKWNDVMVHNQHSYNDFPILMSDCLNVDIQQSVLHNILVCVVFVWFYV